VAKVRAHLPDHVLLSIDVNQKWDLHRAKTAVHALGDLGIQWLEEPMHPDAVHAHSELARMSPVPIALGENVYSAEAFETFFTANAVDVVQVDVTRVAGITEWLRVAHSAQSKGRWVVPHAGDMMQIHQHLVAGISTAASPMIEYLPWGLDVFAEPVHMDRSSISLPETPGASTAIAPQARRAWGSFR
jgi:L-alanine-DL-glutamate epimerase-like enolase superfamily enzyme